MSDTTSKNDELLLKLVDVAADIYVSCRQNHSLTGVSHVYGRKILELFKQYGIQERIDELELEKKAHLFQKKYTAPNSGAGRQIAADLQRVEKRLAELTALKDREDRE